MFTGLVEETGTVLSVRARDGYHRLVIEAETVLEGTRVDDSIAVDGVCLTVVKLEKGRFYADVVRETWQKTTVSGWRSGRRVNLERALRMGDRLGGHVMQGHVDGTGDIRSIEKLGSNHIIFVNLSRPLLKYMAAKGSVGINGVSLTIAEKTGTGIAVSLIPHTLAQTTLSSLHVGDAVNVEIDIMARQIVTYLESFLEQGGLNAEKIKKLGFDDV